MGFKRVGASSASLVIEREGEKAWLEMKRFRHWLIWRHRKQLAPDDAYLSCEYFLPAGTRRKS